MYCCTSQKEELCIRIKTDIAKQCQSAQNHPTLATCHQMHLLQVAQHHAACATDSSLQRTSSLPSVPSPVAYGKVYYADQQGSGHRLPARCISHDTYPDFQPPPPPRLPPAKSVSHGKYPDYHAGSTSYPPRPPPPPPPPSSAAPAATASEPCMIPVSQDSAEVQAGACIMWSAIPCMHGVLHVACGHCVPHH